MESKKTFKRFQDDTNKRKIRKGRRRNAYNDTPNQPNEVPKQKGTSIGGSTTHVLPEPFTKQLENQVIRYDTPPTPEPDF